MTFRAAREQQPHDLTVEYYRTCIAQGVNTIFGVTVGTLGPVSDSQQPLLFAEWQAQRTQDKREKARSRIHWQKRLKPSSAAGWLVPSDLL
jgi:hypothetical protein